MSTFLKLNVHDLAKGLVVVVIGAILASLQQALTAHGLDVTAYDWKMIVEFAIGTGVAYLSKNLLSP